MGWPACASTRPAIRPASVHDNAADYSLANASPTALSKQLAMTWLSTCGHVMRRVEGARLPTVAQLRARVAAAVVKLRTHLAVLRLPATTADRAERSSCVTSPHPA